MPVGSFYRDEKPLLISRRLRRKVWHRVVVAHVLAIFLPMSIMVLIGYFRFQRKDRIQVTIVSNPDASSGGGERQAAKTPPKETPKKNRKTPAAPPEPKVKPRVNPKPIPQPDVRTVIPKRDKKRPKKVEKQTPPRPTPKQPNRPTREFERLTPDQVRDMTENSSSNKRSSSPGRDLGRRSDAAQYAQLLIADISAVWILPSSVLLGSRAPEIYVELDLAADGTVRASRITRHSGNAHADESVRRMLRNLRKVTAPPEPGTIELILVAEPKD